MATFATFVILRHPVTVYWWNIHTKLALIINDTAAPWLYELCLVEIDRGLGGFKNMTQFTKISGFLRSDIKR